jgi:hypothetical protein
MPSKVAQQWVVQQEIHITNQQAIDLLSAQFSRQRGADLPWWKASCIRGDSVTTQFGHIKEINAAKHVSFRRKKLSNIIFRNSFKKG